MILKDNDNNNDRRVIQHNNIYIYITRPLCSHALFFNTQLQTQDGDKVWWPVVTVSRHAAQIPSLGTIQQKPHAVFRLQVTASCREARTPSLEAL